MSAAVVVVVVVDVSEGVVDGGLVVVELALRVCVRVLVHSSVVEVGFGFGFSFEVVGGGLGASPPNHQFP